jgi:hypothetical protein
LWFGKISYKSGKFGPRDVEHSKAVERCPGVKSRALFRGLEKFPSKICWKSTLLPYHICSTREANLPQCSSSPRPTLRTIFVWRSLQIMLYPRATGPSAFPSKRHWICGHHADTALSIGTDFPLNSVDIVGLAQVAQLVEHVTENHGVGGSIPPLGTI